MPVNFYELIGDGGLEGGRAVFEQLIVQLLKVKHPAMGIRARPGDWGIDAVVGDLDGTVSVWQAKFFIEGFGKPQQQQVRDSFAAATKAAAEHGYKIEAWTLCTPVEPDAEIAQWWPGWKRRKQTETGIQIDFWPSSTIEQMLIAPESSAVLRSYFPRSTIELGESSVRLLDLPEETRYDKSLFVRQLIEAGITEHRSAKREFFNYEVLSREVADKAIESEIDTLTTAQAEAHALWESRFVNAQPDEGSGRMPGLHGEVMRAIENLHHHSQTTQPPLSVVHRFGGMHRIVDDGEAGWVRHFRQIAAEHDG